MGIYACHDCAGRHHGLIVLHLRRLNTCNSWREYVTCARAASVAESGDISLLDWVGRSSVFNSCLPADIASYAAPPRVLPSLSEDEIQTAICSLRDWLRDF
ncbi:hypothetical protein BD769DRAFT_1439067 [Suillus cothurnatus]|nr:hypothetical protein BD769DRAFT_1439067 [Suillus cothurnatus]